MSNAASLREVARHEAGHAVIAHALGWTVKLIEIQPVPQTEIEEPNDFQGVLSEVWDLVNANNAAMATYNFEGLHTVIGGTIARRPIANAMIFIFCGELLECGVNRDEFIARICDPSRYRSSPQADANKLRHLDNAWASNHNGSSLRDSLIGRSEKLLRLASPVVDRLVVSLLAENRIGQDHVKAACEENSSDFDSLKQELNALASG